MSRQSHQSGARAAKSSQGGRHRGIGSSYQTLATGQHSVYTHTQYSSQSAQTQHPSSIQQHQPAYEASRTWEQINPEVYRVINDPRLNYTYQSSAATENQADGQSPHQHIHGYAEQCQQTYSQNSGSYRNSTGELTAHQLYTFNHNQQASNRIDVWECEGQREGSWYGSVERG